MQSTLNSSKKLAHSYMGHCLKELRHALLWILQWHKRCLDSNKKLWQHRKQRTALVYKHEVYGNMHKHSPVTEELANIRAVWYSRLGERLLSALL